MISANKPIRVKKRQSNDDLEAKRGDYQSQTCVEIWMHTIHV